MAFNIFENIPDEHEVAASNPEQIIEEYIDYIYYPTAEETAEAYQQIYMPIEQIIETIDGRIAFYRNWLRESGKRDRNFIAPSSNAGLAQSMMRALFKMFHLFYNPESRTVCCVAWENLILCFFSVLLFFSAVVFLGLCIYKYDDCHVTSKMLLDRISQIQDEKMNLLNIIDSLYNQGALFAAVKNATNIV